MLLTHASALSPFRELDGGRAEKPVSFGRRNSQLARLNARQNTKRVVRHAFARMMIPPAAMQRVIARRLIYMERNGGFAGGPNKRSR